MKQQIKTLKKTLKKNASYIRELKAKRKEMSCGYVPGLATAQHEFRIGHIAYCLLRGRTPEQIECRHRDNDEGYRYWKKDAWEKAEQLKKRLEEEAVDETLCPGA